MYFLYKVRTRKKKKRERERGGGGGKRDGSNYYKPKEHSVERRGDISPRNLGSQKYYFALTPTSQLAAVPSNNGVRLLDSFRAQSFGLKKISSPVSFLRAFERIERAIARRKGRKRGWGRGWREFIVRSENTEV